MYDAVIGFAISGILFSLLAILIRVIDPRMRRDRAEILLSIALFAIMWFTFIYLMIVTQYIRYVPYLYNKGIPLYYLIAPCSYFYVWLKLHPVAKMPRSWLLHAIPFVFGLIDIIPYMLISTEEKKTFLADLVQHISLGFEHNYGFIDQKWHYLLKLTLAIFYLLAQWRLLFMADATSHHYRSGQRFSLYGYTLLFSLFILFQWGMVFNVLFNRKQAAYILADFDQLFWISLLYLLFSVWLCIGPYINRISKK